jgi:hypothetical protein
LLGAYRRPQLGVRDLKLEKESLKNSVFYKRFQIEATIFTGRERLFRSPCDN